MLISKFDNANVEMEIKNFEQKHGFSFPEMYKKFGSVTFPMGYKKIVI